MRKDYLFRGLLSLMLMLSLFFAACEKEDEKKPAGPAKTKKAPAEDLASKRILESVYVAQEKYFGEHNTYSQTFRDLNWKPDSKYDYALFLPEEAVQPEQIGPFKLPGGLKAFVTEDAFTAVIAGNIDDDQTLDVWWINDSKDIRHVIDDSSF